MIRKRVFPFFWFLSLINKGISNHTKDSQDKFIGVQNKMNSSGKLKILAAARQGDRKKVMLFKLLIRGRETLKKPEVSGKTC